jgi:hypothetical protein
MKGPRVKLNVPPPAGRMQDRFCDGARLDGTAG